MPFVIRFAEVAGLSSDEPQQNRDIGTATFLTLSSELWEVLTPELRAERITVYEEFPGEHLGGTQVGVLSGAGSATPAGLRSLAPKLTLPEEGASALRVHSNNSVEVVGSLHIDGLPAMLATIQVNIYRAWATGSNDWEGAGDFVFEVHKTAVSQFEGLWDVCGRRNPAMLPTLKKWIEGVERVSSEAGGRHRIRWAALMETGGGRYPPQSGMYALYRARTLGKPSLLASNLKEAAREELSGIVPAGSDAFEATLYREAIEAEVQAMVGTNAFPQTAEAFQASALAAYGQGGSEHFVFRDPDGPRKAAGDLVRQVRARLVERVRARVGEGQVWDAALRTLVPAGSRRSRRPKNLDGFE